MKYLPPSAVDRPKVDTLARVRLFLGEEGLIGAHSGKSPYE